MSKKKLVNNPQFLFRNYLNNTKSLKKIPEETKKKEKKISLNEAKKLGNRLNSYKTIYEQKTEKLRQESEETQKNFFTPNTGRPPRFLTPEKPKIAFNFIKKNWQRLFEEKDSEFNHSKSLKILNSSKKKRLKELIEILNPVEETIHIRNIKLESIPKEIVMIMLPLLKEIAEVPEGINFEVFSEAFENLLKTLSVMEKNALINTARKVKEEQSSFSFKPSINQSSFDIKNTVLDRSAILLEKKSAGILQKKLRSAQKEIECCTFSPVTTKYKKKHFLSCWDRYASPLPQ